MSRRTRAAWPNQTALKSRGGLGEAAATHGASPKPRCILLPGGLASPGAARGRRPIVRVFKTEGADSGGRLLALLFAREVAIIVVIPVAAARTPGIRSRRLRRCRVHFAEQHRRNQQKRKSWQAHGSPRSCPKPAVAGGPSLDTIVTTGRVLLERNAPGQKCARQLADPHCGRIFTITPHNLLPGPWTRL